MAESDARREQLLRFFGGRFGDAVLNCCNWLIENGLEVDGIFRPLSDEKDVEVLRFKVEKGVDVNLDSYKGSAEGVRVVAELYKQFFRFAQQPVFPVEQYDEFIAVQRAQTPRQRESLRLLLQKLPASNLAVLQHLVNFLRLVASRAAANGMPAINLAIVFAPYLLRSPRPSVMQSVNDAPHVNGLIQLLLEDPRILVSDDRPSQWRHHVEPVSPPSGRSPRFRSDSLGSASSLLTGVEGALLARTIGQSVQGLFEVASLAVTPDVVLTAQPASGSALSAQQARITDLFGSLQSATLSLSGSGAASSRSDASAGGSGALPLQDGTAFLRKSLEVLRRERTSANRPAELNRMSQQQLRQEKSAIKRELRAYDTNFVKAHGREPSKADKEPMRPLYQRYKDVKQLLGLPPHAHAAQQQAALAAAAGGAVPSGSAGATGASPPARPSTAPSSGRTSVDSLASLASAPSNVGASANSVPALARPSSAPSQPRVNLDVQPNQLPPPERERAYASLKSEKRALQIKLTEFQKEFIKTHGRKVKYREDRLPMEDEYQRYKAIKQKLAEFESAANH